MIFTNTPWADRLNELTTLEDGWYWDNDGKAINPFTLASAHIILYTCVELDKPIPSIFPAIDEGYGIMLEWHNRFLKQALHLQITNDVKYDIYFIDISLPFTNENSYHGLETESMSEAIQFMTKYLNKFDFIKEQYGTVD